MSVRKMSYCYVSIPDRPGQGARVLGELKKARVNLLAYSGFPTRGGKAQLDFVAADLKPIRRLADRNGWRLSPVKKGFLIQGTDRPGAVHSHLSKLANLKINVTAADAVVAGKQRFGMLLWVRDKDFSRAARVLKAK